MRLAESLLSSVKVILPLLALLLSAQNINAQEISQSAKVAAPTTTSDDPTCLDRPAAILCEGENCDEKPLQEVKKEIVKLSKKNEEVKNASKALAVARTNTIQLATRVQNIAQTAGNLNTEVIMSLINQHRSNIGLSPLVKDENLCTIARSRGPELTGEVANGSLHSGLYRRNLPFWITENMKYGGNEAETVQWWLNSPVHRAAIEGNYVYSCGECVGDTCAQLFTSYTPK